MHFKTYNFIAGLSVLSVIVPIAFFLLVIRKKYVPGVVKLIGALLLISGLSDLISGVLVVYRLNPNGIVTTFVILQFILLNVIYFLSHPVFRRITIIVTSIFFFFALYNLFVLQGIDGFNSNSFTISSIVFIIYSILFSYKLLVDLPYPQLEKQLMFWFNSAVLMYFSCNLFVFTTVSYLIESKSDQLLLSWAFHNGFNILKNMVFAIALAVAWKSTGE